jgi:hypothetical protein
LARPRSLEGHVLELEAELLGDDLAAREDGDVLQHLLAAIAEARGLDGAHCSVPRSLLTTSVARASPSTSSAMIRSGLLLPWRSLLEHREQVLHVGDLLLVR